MPLSQTDIAELDPQVYLDALGAFDTLGWGQGSELCDDGSVCAIGAVQVGLGLVPHVVPGEPRMLVPVGYPPFPRMTEEQVEKERDYFGGRFTPVYAFHDSELYDKQQSWSREARQALARLNYGAYIELLDDIVSESKIVQYRWSEDEDSEEQVEFYSDVVEFNDSVSNDGGRERVADIFRKAVTRIVAAKAAVKVDASV